jgi:hypothetical protein
MKAKIKTNKPVKNLVSKYLITLDLNYNYALPREKCQQLYGFQNLQKFVCKNFILLQYF